MKKIFLPLIGVSLLVLAGCATTPSRDPHSARPPVAVATPAADLLVISAVYGSGTKFADVTYRVDDLLHQPGVEFFARPEWLRADPNSGWNKDLVIVYDVKGQRRIFTAHEGGRVSANLLMERPQPPKPVKQTKKSKKK